MWERQGSILTRVRILIHLKLGERVVKQMGFNGFNDYYNCKYDDSLGFVGICLSFFIEIIPD